MIWEQISNTEYVLSENKGTYILGRIIYHNENNGWSIEVLNKYSTSFVELGLIEVNKIKKITIDTLTISLSHIQGIIDIYLKYHIDIEN